MGRVNLKIALFTLAVIGVYTYYANSIPQIESRPPEEVTVRAEELSPEELVALGEKVVSTKGGCLVCHGIGQAGARAPDLAGVGARAATRKPGMSAVQYLIESLVHPSAFVVEGYPPIMPPVDKPPISLNRTELLAVVAYLQSLGGQVTVKPGDLPATVGEAPTASPAAAPTPPAPASGQVGATGGGTAVVGDPAAGRLIFEDPNKGGCLVCHKVGGKGGGPPGAPPMAPDLTDVGKRLNPEKIRESILNPAAEIVPGFAPIMPPIFGEKLKAKEFEDLVAYLASLKGGKTP